MPLYPGRRKSIQMRAGTTVLRGRRSTGPLSHGDANRATWGTAAKRAKVLSSPLETASWSAVEAASS